MFNVLPLMFVLRLPLHRAVCASQVPEVSWWSHEGCSELGLKVLGFRALTLGKSSLVRIHKAEAAMGYKVQKLELGQLPKAFLRRLQSFFS